MTLVALSSDNKFEIKEMDGVKGKYSYLKTDQVLGSMALILPYKKRMGVVSYLLRREYIPCWDHHTDVCGITVFGPESQLESLLSEALLKETGYKIRATELKSLGVCACDRHTDTACYLYCVDLTRHSPEEEKLEVEEEMSFWGNTEDILESLDSQLITCYAKVHYLLL